MIIAKISMLKVLKNLTLLHKFNLAMEKSKNTRYSNLPEKSSPKTYWSVLKRFFNKNIPCIPSLVYKNKFVTDFQRKS